MHRAVVSFFALLPIIVLGEWTFTSTTGGGVLSDNSGWSFNLTLSDTSFTITKATSVGTDTDVDISGDITGFPAGHSITTIGIDAFASKALTSIKLPNTITTIGTRGFQNCTSLTNIVFPQGLTQIRDSAFLNCSSLQKVILPDSLATIGKNAFQNIGAELVSFGKNSVTINSSAFCNSPSIRYIYFTGDAPIMNGGSIFLNSAKNSADSTLADKTRCYFIPYANPTWSYLNAALPLEDGDIDNFATLFPNIPTTPAGLFHWFSLRSEGNDVNLAANKQYLCYYNPEFGKVIVQGAPFELGTPTPAYGHTTSIGSNQSLTLSAPASVNGTNCLGYILATIPEYGKPTSITTNLNATTLTLDYTDGISYLVTWLWDCETPYVHLTKGDPTERNSMITSGGWSDYRIPHSDANYLVALGIDAPLNTAKAAGYTPSLSYATTTWAGGAITLGTPDGKEGYIDMMDSGHISNQKFGIINVYNGGILKTTPPGGSRSTFNAKPINVYATQENPMKIYGAATVATYLSFSAGALASDTNAAIYIGNRPDVGNGITVVFADNGNYKGSIEVDGENTILQLAGGNTSSTMLGANPKTLRPKHLVLKNGATLYNSNGYSSTTTQSNQGIYIDESGAFIRKTGRATTFNGPISGPGKVVFYSSASLKTTFNNSITVSSLLISNSLFTCSSGVSSSEDTSVEAASGATLDAYAKFYNTLGELILSTNGIIYVRDATPVTIEKANLKQGTIKLDLNTTDGTCDLFQLGAGSKVEGPINITTTTPLPLYDGVKAYKFMTIPLSTGRLTWRNFDASGVVFDTEDGLDPDGILIPKVVVEYTSDGLQHIYLKRGLKRKATTMMIR